MALTIQLTQLKVESVKILQCAYGELNAGSIKLEINNGFRVAKPFLNKLLSSKPIQFPTEVLGLFKLEAMTLAYYDDYFYAGITPVFIGPQSVSKAPLPSNEEFFMDTENSIYLYECMTEQTFEVLEDGTEHITIETFDFIYELLLIDDDQVVQF